MTNADFAARITAMQGTLYRISCTLLRLHADREDAVRSAIEKAWRKHGDLRDDSRFRAWVVRILINECRSLLRLQERETPAEELPDVPAPEDADSDLYRFFTQLPDALRLTMVLHYVSLWIATEDVDLAGNVIQGSRQVSKKLLPRNAAGAVLMSQVLRRPSSARKHTAAGSSVR